ncbi:MAG: cation:proton antiporter [Vicinamibacterales bacterium]
MGIAADFVLIVIAGLGGAVVARALGMPLLVGYVAAGVVVGPHTAGPTVGHIEDIELLAEIGVALLLFALGLEVSFRDLRAVRRVAVIGGPIQIVVTLLFGMVVARAVTGMATRDAVWFGAMVALSSTMVVLKTLAAEGTMATLASRVMIGLLVIQDLAVVPLLIVLPQIGSGGLAVGGLATAIGLAATFLVGMVVAGTRLLPAMLRQVVHWKSRELFLVAVVAAGVGVGFIAFSIGLSFAIGAFVAGMVLSESELSHQALSDVGPLRDVFGLIFFVTVGMLFDPRYALGHAWQVAALVLAILCGKAVICGLLVRAFGYRNMAPWIVGLGLSQIGEFSFVLARTGRAGGFITSDTYDLALSCTVLTMALSPLVFPGLLPAARRLMRRYPPAAPATNLHLPRTTLENHVVIAGYGRTGRAVVDALERVGLPYLVVELNHDAIAAPLEAGLPGIWGDIASADIQRAAGVPQARMLVMAVPEWHAIHVGIDQAKRLNPRIFVIARATAVAHVDDLRTLRVDAVVQPEFEGGIEMVRRALAQCERRDEEIDQVTAALRRALYEPSLDA